MRRNHKHHIGSESLQACLYFSFFSETVQTHLAFFYLASRIFISHLALLCCSENYLYAIQLKGTQGAKAWPVLWLVKLELKGSVQLKSRVIIIIITIIIIIII